MLHSGAASDGGNKEQDGDFEKLGCLEFVYNMNHPKRGKFIIINNKKFHPKTELSERPGTDLDASNLFEVFKKFGFDVSLYDNLTAKATMELMKTVSREDHSDSDCFGAAVLTHGDMDVLYGTDSAININDFVKPIKLCSTLVGKPKLFFFQACRGTNFDDGMIQSDSVGDEVDSAPRLVIPMEADVLYAYSTVPGYFAWRNSSQGSWFIRALTQVLNKPDSHQMEFVRLLTRVSHAVAYQFESKASRPELNHKKQVPSIVSMLTKDLYLGPKT